jgi:prolyl-tRNA synthetase
MALTSMKQDISEWYNELIQQADLAQHSAVRGCMVIKPYGYAMRENMQKVIDIMFKRTGIAGKKHQNAYFPLLIPKSFFTKEAKHVEWFATEAAVVTHYRLKKNEATGTIEVDPEAKLEEELIIRPTSETIIWNTFKDWIQSYRDLPLLINQWANVMRWEMRTRPFLRTAEFLWQEWHTAHATEAEAIVETEQMWNVYQDFFTNFMAVSGVMWCKTESEKFAWAETTYTIEHMMPDGKALQSCTSHYLGQNFGKAFDVQFVNQNNEREYAYATSWGISTRALGGMFMAHGDDKWLIVPPALAPFHVVVIPVAKNEEILTSLMSYLQPSLNAIESSHLTIESRFLGTYQIPLVVKIDDDSNKTNGWKYNQYELQWVPLRIAVWPRDMENWVVEVYRRDTGDKQSIALADLPSYVTTTLQQIQANMLTKNKTMRSGNTVTVNTRDEFVTAIEDGKFVMAHWDGTPETEDKIKELTKATSRCIPADSPHEAGKCIITGNPSTQRILFAKNY